MKNKDEFPVIFISWSGAKDREIAEAIQDTIEHHFKVKCFVSSRDIDAKEEGWWESIKKNLCKASFGILVMSNATRNKPWILYEAGVLEGRLKFKKVIPFLLDFTPEKMPSPLQKKQARKKDKEGVTKLINQDIASVFGAPSPKFTAKSWQKFNKRLDAILTQYKIKSIKKKSREDERVLERRGEANSLINSIQREKKKEAEEYIKKINTEYVMVKILKTPLKIAGATCAKNALIKIPLSEAEKFSIGRDIEITPKELKAVQFLNSELGKKKGSIGIMVKEKAEEREKKNLIKILKTIDDLALPLP